MEHPYRVPYAWSLVAWRRVQPCKWDTCTRGGRIGLGRARISCSQWMSCGGGRSGRGFGIWRVRGHVLIVAMSRGLD